MPTPAITITDELRPTNRAGAAMTAGSIATTVLAFSLASRSALAPWLVGEVLLAVAFNQWFSLLHEAGHETLFRSRRANALAGHLAGLFALIPFRAWKPIHALHHKWTGWQDLDPTTAALVPRRLAPIERVVVDLAWRLWLPLFSVLYRVGNYWNPIRLRRLVPEPDRRRQIVANSALLVAAYAASAYLLSPLGLLRLVGLGLLLALVFQDILILSQHTHLPQRRSGGGEARPIPAREQIQYSRSLRVPAWMSHLVLFHLDAHELHHAYPAVPGFLLARLGDPTPNAIDLWTFARGAKRLRGEVFLFQDRNQTGAAI